MVFFYKAGLLALRLTPNLEGQATPTTKCQGRTISMYSGYIGRRGATFSTPINNSNTSYQNIITKNVFQFVINLYKKPTITKTLMQKIVDEVLDLFSIDIVLFLKNMAMTHLKGCSISEKN
jgi:hypothetical protein